MKSISPILLVAGSGVALAAPGPSLYQRGMSLFKRWDYDVCQKDCTLAGVAIPDNNNFQLPLEKNYPEQCPEIYLKEAGVTSRVCLDFVGHDVVFNFAPIPGYTYLNAAVGWKVKGNMIKPETWSAAPPPCTGEISCTPNASGDGGLVCKLPFSDILSVPPRTSTRDLLAGICPNADREALGFYFQFSGQVRCDEDSKISSLHQQYPCKSRDSNRQCTAWDTSYDYIEVSYRCSKCNVSPCPGSSTTTTTDKPTPTTTTTTDKPTPTTTTTTDKPTPTTTTSTTKPTPTVCEFGTAFGYQPGKSQTLDTQPGQGCNRWGWYQTPTKSELRAGISGPLYVGAGRNDISKATQVGTWTATADSSGKVTVTYLVTPPYAIDEVHVDLSCLPIDKCAPGSYTFGNDNVGHATKYSTPALVYPSCPKGYGPALIIHAAIVKSSETSTCPEPVKH